MAGTESHCGRLLVVPKSSRAVGRHLPVCRCVELPVGEVSEQPITECRLKKKCRKQVRQEELLYRWSLSCYSVRCVTMRFKV